jgi:formylmethanofuran dehydrogenase subunit E
MNIPDNYDLWTNHDRRQEQQLEQLPVCEDAKCGKRIQEDRYFVIEGEILCEDCVNRRYGRNTADYFGDFYE